MNMISLDQNAVVIVVVAVILLLIYWLLNYTSKGKQTAGSFKKKERKWLKQEKKFIGKLVKWILLPITIFWIVIDVAFVAIANYYFHNVIFEPIFHFTPMQTLIATILVLFLVYAIYKSFIKRGSKN